MTDFSTLTWVVWGGSCAAFYLGAISATLIPQQAPAKASMVLTQPAWRWLYGMIGVYIFGIAMGLHTLGTWPAFSRHPGEDRLTFQQGPFMTGQLQHACWVLLATTPLFATLTSGWKRKVSWLIYIVAMSYGLLTGFRMVMFFGIFSALVTRDLLLKQIHVFKTGVYLLGSLVLFCLVLLPRVGISAFQGNNLLHMGASFFLHQIYDYIANNFWNLDFAISRQVGIHPHPTTWGGLMFEIPLVLLGIAGKIESAYGWDSWRNDLSLKTSSLNTISYQWALLKEFGWLGVIFIPYGIGAFATWLYRRVELFKSQWATLLYIPISFSILFSFFLYMYQTPMYWLILVSYLALWAATRTSSSSRNPPMSSSPYSKR